MSLPRYSTERPVSIAMLFLAIALLGVISFIRLPIDLLPDIAYPKLVIYTSYPDVAPAEVERVVTDLVEANVAAVPGVESVSSVSREGVSLVTLRFAWGTDMRTTVLNVRERLDNARGRLPERAERPTLLTSDPGERPIAILGLTGPGDLRAIARTAADVHARRFEQLDGVASVAVVGAPQDEIRIELDPEKLRAIAIGAVQPGSG